MNNYENGVCFSQEFILAHNWSTMLYITKRLRLCIVFSIYSGDLDQLSEIYCGEMV